MQNAQLSANRALWRYGFGRSFDNKRISINSLIKLRHNILRTIICKQLTDSIILQQCKIILFPIFKPQIMKLLVVLNIIFWSVTSLIAQYNPSREVEVFKSPLPHTGIIRNDGEYNYYVTLHNPSKIFTYTFPGYTFVTGSFEIVNDTIYMTPAVIADNNRQLDVYVLGDSVDYTVISMPRRFVRQGNDTLVELYNNSIITLSLIEDIKQTIDNDTLKDQLIETYNKWLMKEDIRIYFNRVL